MIKWHPFAPNTKGAFAEVMRRRDPFLLRIGGHMVTAYYRGGEEPGFRTTHNDEPVHLTRHFTLQWAPLDAETRLLLDLPAVEG